MINNNQNKKMLNNNNKKNIQMKEVLSTNINLHYKNECERREEEDAQGMTRTSEDEKG
eukprot:m.108177 g.108177  ORF g.108177 m.108177 type:complete len:58 (+) comp15208_c2_seq3:745-918(+)